MLERLRPGSPAAASVHATLPAGALVPADLAAAREALTKAEAISAEFGGLGWTDSDHRVRLGLALAERNHAEVDAIVEQATRAMTGDWQYRQQWAVYAHARARSLWTATARSCPWASWTLCICTEGSRPSAANTQVKQAVAESGVGV